MSPSDGSLKNAAARARSFGAVADAYDRIRPGYPAQLFDDLLAYAGPVGRALEVGAGTGRATAELVARGLAVHAVEHDPAMASVLASRLPTVEVTVGGFETEPTDGPYDLLVSAQAWHWIDPDQRWVRAAQCLRPGGALALFWNHDLPADELLRVQVQAAHDEWTPGIRVDDEAPMGDVLAEWPGPQLAELTDFADVQAHRYGWERTLTGVDYVELLSTMSAYSVRTAEARAGLFDALLEIVDDAIVLSMETVLYLARRT
jgi:SAM-dependent methyltransferase